MNNPYYKSPVVVVRCHLLSLDFHSATEMSVLNLIFSLRPCSSAASLRYVKISSAVAIGVLDLQIFHEKLKKALSF